MGDIKTKTAQFARLFDLFEHLASQGLPNRDDLSTSASANSGVEDDYPSIQVSADLASVLQRLETFLATRADIRQHKTGGTPSKNVVMSSGLPENKLESIFQGITKFPLGEQYPFTFKLMIHKLYDLAGWAEMVKEVVEKSQMQFKPLGEWENKRAEDENTIRNKKVAVAAAGRRGSLQHTRPRSHSMVGITKTDIRIALAAKAQLSKTMDGESRADIRALKKRCVGRRKSTSGLVTGNLISKGGNWTYEAAVSLIECHGHGQYRDIDPADHSFWWRPSSARLKTREKVESKPESSGAKLESEEPVIWEWDIPPQPLQRNTDVLARRKAMSLADIGNHSPRDDVTRTKMKRPLSPP